MKRLMAVVAALLVLGVTGCGGSDSGLPDDTLTLGPAGTSAAAPATSAPAGTGPVYKLSGNLCQKADQSPLADLYPIGDDKPLVATHKLCATSRKSQTVTVALSIDADLMPNERTAKLFVETGRRLARSTPTDIEGAGSDAFWTGTEKDVKLTAYHGNLVLEVSISNLSTKVPFPDGMPERLVRVAAGTYAHLAA